MRRKIFIEKIGTESDIIETRYILRDENLELMDLFLTKWSAVDDKGRSIQTEFTELLQSWSGRKTAEANV